MPAVRLTGMNLGGLFLKGKSFFMSNVRSASSTFHIISNDLCYAVECSMEGPKTTMLNEHSERTAKSRN